MATSTPQPVNQVGLGKKAKLEIVYPFGDKDSFLPFPPTEGFEGDKGKATRARNERNEQLIKEGKATKEAVTIKVNDKELGKSFQAQAYVVSYTDIPSFVSAYGNVEALKLANSAADLRQRASYSAILRAKAEGPEKNVIRLLKAAVGLGADREQAAEMFGDMFKALGIPLEEVLNKVLASKEDEEEDE
jgi:hypothetical protein